MRNPSARTSDIQKDRTHDDEQGLSTLTLFPPTLIVSLSPRSISSWMRSSMPPLAIPITHIAHQKDKKKPTPIGILFLSFPNPLYKVMLQQICHFNGMVDLHRRVDALAAMAVEVPPRFLTGSNEDARIIYKHMEMSVSAAVIWEEAGCLWCLRRMSDLGKRLWWRGGVGGRRFVRTGPWFRGIIVQQM